ncbi:hypothetical protein PQR14_27575 [Paraburkholderia bryophila]|uniref:hypothetical protein n=1 Tax=Paraburkholderia bryophila TaxID=420952 RepID=UPI0038B7DBC6
MSYESLRADAECMYISPWHLPRECRFKKTSEVLRTELVARLYGPGHPGFKAKLADIDAHLTVLVDCTQGRHGRALQIAINAYNSAQRATETLAGMTAKRRGRDRAIEAETAADVRQWLAIFRAARQVFLAARAVRGECAIDVLPEGCESPNYLVWQQMTGTGKPVGDPVKERWRIPKPAPVIGPAAALISASADAVSLARSAADAGNVLRLARLDAAPVVRLPEVCGIEDTPAPRESVPQTLVAELGRFISKLETHSKEITAA